MSRTYATNDLGTLRLDLLVVGKSSDELDKDFYNAACDEMRFMRGIHAVGLMTFGELHTTHVIGVSYDGRLRTRERIAALPFVERIEDIPDIPDTEEPSDPDSDTPVVSIASYRKFAYKG